MFDVQLNLVNPPNTLFNNFPSVLFVALRLQGVLLFFDIGKLLQILIHYSRQIYIAL